MINIQVWREGTPGEPKFSKDFKVAKKAVLQITDIKTNRNKYYAIELHAAKDKYRIYTHYGRTDDLDSNPEAGVRESRYCNSLQEAEDIYQKIFTEKTSPRKGYKEINLASSKIGSKKTFGKSSGIVDQKTLSKLKDKPNKVVCTLSKPLQELISYIYSEATNTLIKTVNVNITANGIETPLGVLTLAQIDKGQEYLDQLTDLLAKNKTKSVQDDMIQLSGEFYTVVPHKFGRSKEAAQEAVINSMEKLTARQDTLQLMKDMLNVNSKGNVLVNPAIEQKYKALDCKIEFLDKDSAEFKKISSFIVKSKAKGYGSLKVKNIYTLRREAEHTAFAKDIGNDKLLFHGSNIQNWVGILSRGILLPKVVIKLGVSRTDSGWLGHGIYFGDAIDTSLNYAESGSKGTSLIAIATVALGKMKDYNKITHGLISPPNGYDSCHGVRGTEFYDDEYVIYAHNQQKLEYLVEI